MRIFVKNKLVTLRGSSFAVDQSGGQIFRIKGKFFTFTRKKFVMDMSGKKLFTVQTRFFNFIFHKSYVKGADGKKILSVRNKIALNNTLKIEPLNGEDISLCGDFLNWNMTVFKNGLPIGDIHRDFDLFRDSFVLDGNP